MVNQNAAYKLNKAIYCASSIAYYKMQKKNVSISACNEILNYVNSAAAPIKLLVAGEFSNGKSTLINALLGKEMLKSDVLATTAVNTQICYGDEEKISIVFKNGTYADYDIKYLKDISSETDNSFSGIRKDIERIYVFQHVDFLRNINIIDSPGTNVNIEYHNENAQRIYSEIDFAIWVMNIRQPVRKTEVESIKRLPKHIRTLIVFNKIDALEDDEESVDDVLKIAFSKVNDISIATVGVSALQALEAKQNNNIDLYKRSRWSDLLDAIEKHIYNKTSELKLNALIGQIQNAVDSEIIHDISDSRKKLTLLYDTIKYGKARNIAGILGYREQHRSYNLHVRESMREMNIDCEDIQILSEINRVFSMGYALRYMRAESSVIQSYISKNFANSFFVKNMNTIRDLVNVYYDRYSQALSLYNDYIYARKIGKDELIRYMNSIVSTNKMYYEVYVSFYKAIEQAENEILNKHEDEINGWQRSMNDYEVLNYRICMTEMGDMILKNLGSE